MSAGNVAERYAQALFELGAESGELPLLAEKVSAFADVYSSDRMLRHTLGNPLVPVAERKALLEAILRRLALPEIGRKGLLVVFGRRRLYAIRAIAERLLQLADIKAGVLRASVTTVRPMPESFYASLTQKLGAVTGRKVVLERKIDASLIGGAITRVGDASVDGSVRGQLVELERQLGSALRGAAPAT